MWKVYRTLELNLRIITLGLFLLSTQREILSLLVGGNKSNDKNFYYKITSKAEKLFLKHIEDIQRIFILN
jgi:hypothetical protein